MLEGVDGALADIVGAALDDVTVDWRNGIVRITFLAAKGGEAHALRATDFTRVDIPRGKSRLVKSATRKDKTTEIVMDGGETLRIDSDAIAIDALGG